MTTVIGINVLILHINYLVYRALDAITNYFELMIWRILYLNPYLPLGAILVFFFFNPKRIQINYLT